jgi:serine/threonine-protein kinase
MGTMTHQPRVLGRYALYGELASGGMATVHLGRSLGAVGFSRAVAIKRPHPQFAKDPSFVAMFVDEARLAARIRHPNVTTTLDVVSTGGELYIVMEYVHGEPLSRLLAAISSRSETVPLGVVSAVMVGTLEGLHAAHEAKDEHGRMLHIVHRDVSPQNVLVGVDGVPRVLDFGIAKARGRLQTTSDHQLKGKTAYMAPEQLEGDEVSRRTDIWAASVVLWEMLTGRRLFVADSQSALMKKVLEAKVPPPSSVRPCPPEMDVLVLKGLSRDPEARFATAREMAFAIEEVAQPATPRVVGAWVEENAGAALAERAASVRRMEAAEVSHDQPSVRSQLAEIALINAPTEIQARSPMRSSPDAETATGLEPHRPPPAQQTDPDSTDVKFTSSVRPPPRRRRWLALVPLAVMTLAAMSLVWWRASRPIVPIAAATVNSVTEPTPPVSAPVSAPISAPIAESPVIKLPVAPSGSVSSVAAPQTSRPARPSPPGTRATAASTHDPLELDKRK